MRKANQSTRVNTYMPRKRDLGFRVGGAHKCKIIILYFNIMSAFATKFLCLGQILARIFKVYNTVIYCHLRHYEPNTAFKT